MHDDPTEQDFNDLQQFTGGPCLTIYVPPADKASGPDANRALFRNALKSARSHMLDHAINADQTDLIIATIWQYIDSNELWPPSRKTAAIFASTDYMRVYHLPANQLNGTSVTVGRSFDLAPFASALSSDRKYLVLVLGHQNVRLLRGTRDSLQPVELPGFPADMKQTLGIDEYPNARSVHSVKRAGRSTQVSLSQYSPNQTDKTMLQEFFRRIDHQLHSYLQQHKLPLILAGVDYLQAIYRHVNTYPALTATGITGSQDQTSGDSIREEAWAIVGS